MENKEKTIPKEGNKILITTNINRNGIFTKKFDVYTINTNEILFTKDISRIMYYIKEDNYKYFYDNEFRIWEEKDEDLRNKFYEFSKLLRGIWNKIEKDEKYKFYDDQMRLKKDQKILKQHYDNFMVNKILEKKTIMKLNFIYKYWKSYKY